MVDLKCVEIKKESLFFETEWIGISPYFLLLKLREDDFDFKHKLVPCHYVNGLSE